MTRLIRLFCGLFLLAPTAGMAAEAHLCSGLGEDARLEAEAFPHNLRLVHAGRDGHYLGDIDIVVARGGETVLSLTCDGPWLLMDVAPGTYTVTSTYQGEIRQTRVTVGRRVRRVEKTIHF